ncbi:MAG: hypothetical protein N2Z69_03865 [Methylophilaceae bacterium]|nr:hypothetical protein [Methylophilaceae bacterium]
MKKILWLLLFLPTLSQAAQVEFPLINLIHPTRRVEAKTGPVDDMRRYIREVKTEISAQLANVQANPGWGFLVIAVREDGRIKAWLDTDDVLPSVVTQTMVSVAQSTEGFRVKSGAVVFALGFGINGGNIPLFTQPFPVEWKKAAACENHDCLRVDVERLVLETW